MKNKSMLSLLLAFVLLFGISLPAVNAEEAVQSSPIKIGAMFSPDDTLDPVTVTSPGGMFLMMSLYDSLVTMHPDGPILRMAESIEANDTLDAYTITLKEGLRQN